MYVCLCVCLCACLREGQGPTWHATKGRQHIASVAACIVCCVSPRDEAHHYPLAHPLTHLVTHPPHSQELPCGHPIINSYTADLQQRMNLAQLALNPQGRALTLNPTEAPLSPAAAAGTASSSQQQEEPSASQGSAESEAPPEADKKHDLGSNEDSSGSSSGTQRPTAPARPGRQLVFRSKSWVVGVDKYTGVYWGGGEDTHLCVCCP